jgi:hypothetical protein
MRVVGVSKKLFNRLEMFTVYFVASMQDTRDVAIAEVRHEQEILHSASIE